MDRLLSVFSGSWSFLLMALGLGLVIFVHELGHFAVAKWVGVLVERFSIGFGPVLWSFRRGETEYALSAIPFGGYVKMLGQDDSNPSDMVNEDIRKNPRSYPAQSVPKRMAIISAGVIMNIIFGFLFFLLVFNLGVPYTPAVVGHVEPGGSAWKAGLERGDKVVKINGEEVIEGFEALQQATILGDTSKAINLEVERGGTTLNFRVFPEAGETDLAPQIGILPSLSLSLFPKDFVAAGTAASKVEGAQFEGGDRITHANGHEVHSYPEFAEFLARHAAEEIRVTVVRAAKKGTSTHETAEIVIPPQFMRDLGIRLQMGKITALRAGSSAELAGFKVGDVIQSVEGKPFDPLRLPDQMAKLSGRGVDVEIKRQSQGEQVISLTVRPDDLPGWLTPPRLLGDQSPLTIPALGIAYQLVPAITHEPNPDSPAGLAGLHKDDRILAATLIRPAEENEKKDKPREFKIDDKSQALPEIFWWLQHDQQLKLKLNIKRGESVFWTEPFSPEYDPTWPALFRGIVLMPLSERMEPQGPIRSVVLGYRTTKNWLANTYLTLRQLVSRRVSPKLLSGPVGIASLGYQMAATDITLLIKFMAILSINLAIINFLPIPVLDGGHMVFLAWEGIRGRPASERVLIAANYCGLVLILCLAAFVTWQDITRHLR